MKNLYDVIENTSKKEKMWVCIKVELDDLKKNPAAFGVTKLDIINEYLAADENFIDDNFELYVLSGDIIL